MKVNPIDLQKGLAGVSYPTDKDGLVSAAKSNGADQEVIDALQSLDDKSYDGPDQVSKALG
ncbi:MAG: DUF2795 domain-containing protein [Aldersonia sp.]|nr:DUF2795 domain-containing protein [Aldersonia sp.]